MIAAVWVTEGIDRCVVGYVPPKYNRFLDDLNGRLAQVTSIYSKNDGLKRKRDFHNYQGVVRAVLIEGPGPVDEEYNRLLSDDEISSESE